MAEVGPGSRSPSMVNPVKDPASGASGLQESRQAPVQQQPAQASRLRNGDAPPFLVAHTGAWPVDPNPPRAQPLPPQRAPADIAQEVRQEIATAQGIDEWRDASGHAIAVAWRLHRDGEDPSRLFAAFGAHRDPPAAVAYAKLRGNAPHKELATFLLTQLAHAATNGLTEPPVRYSQQIHSPDHKYTGFGHGGAGGYQRPYDDTVIASLMAGFVDAMGGRSAVLAQPAIADHALKTIATLAGTAGQLGAAQLFRGFVRALENNPAPLPDLPAQTLKMRFQNSGDRAATGLSNDVRTAIHRALDRIGSDAEKRIRDAVLAHPVTPPAVVLDPKKSNTPAPIDTAANPGPNLSTTDSSIAPPIEPAQKAQEVSAALTEPHPATPSPPLVDPDLSQPDTKHTQPAPPQLTSGSIQRPDPELTPMPLPLRPESIPISRQAAATATAKPRRQPSAPAVSDPVPAVRAPTKRKPLWATTEMEKLVEQFGNANQQAPTVSELNGRKEMELLDLARYLVSRLFIECAKAQQEQRRELLETRTEAFIQQFLQADEMSSGKKIKISNNQKIDMLVRGVRIAFDSTRVHSANIPKAKADATRFAEMLARTAGAECLIDLHNSINSLFEFRPQLRTHLIATVNAALPPPEEN